MNVIPLVLPEEFSDFDRVPGENACGHGWYEPHGNRLGNHPCKVKVSLCRNSFVLKFILFCRNAMEPKQVPKQQNFANDSKIKSVEPPVMPGLQEDLAP